MQDNVNIYQKLFYGGKGWDEKKANNFIGSVFQTQINFVKG